MVTPDRKNQNKETQQTSVCGGRGAGNSIFGLPLAVSVSSSPESPTMSPMSPSLAIGNIHREPFYFEIIC